MRATVAPRPEMVAARLLSRPRMLAAAAVLLETLRAGMVAGFG